MALSGENLRLAQLRPIENVLGIDLGTTNTVIAVWLKGADKPNIISMENNYRTLPSYVSFKDDGNLCEVGRNAERNIKQYPLNTCYDAKRMIGKSYSSTTDFQSEYWSFKVVNDNGRPAYQLASGKLIHPERVSTEVLKRAKQVAEAATGVTFTYAVITVPAYFGQNEKQATIDAAQAAHLRVLRLETEPSAAGYCYHYDHKRFNEYNLFVFDLGGGTFDITILSVDEEGRFHVKTSGGDNNLGGRDFDNMIMEDLSKKLTDKGAKNLDILKSKIRLRQTAEEIKLELTNSEEKIVNCDDYITSQDEKIIYTRAEYEKITQTLQSRLRYACDQTLAEAKLDVSDIDNVLLIGGSSRMPLVQNLVMNIFPQAGENKFYMAKSVNADEAVAYGAAIRAAQLCDPDNRDFENSITNVLPIGIGIGLIENRYSLMMKRGTRYPTRIKKRYFTSENDQKNAVIQVFEGERVEASENREIFTVTLDNLPPGLAGDVYVEVTFELDKNGILTVTAKSLTGSTQGTVDYRKGGNNGKPIENVFQELSLNPENEKHKKLLLDARAELRQNMEVIKGRYEHETNIPYNKQQKIIEDCKTVIEWLDENKDVTVDPEYVELARKIENDANELINFRLMTISK